MNYYKLETVDLIKRIKNNLQILQPDQTASFCVLDKIFVVDI